MKKMLFVMPALLTGCTGFSPLRSPAPEPQVPALVFVDGQIRSSAETVAHTQQQVRATVPAPAHSTPVPPTPVTAAPVSSAVPATSPSSTLTGPAAPAATTAAGLHVTGTPQKPAVISLPGVSNLTTEQWIRRILPDGWQLQYENALRQTLSTRHKTIWQNDEWTRVLERLLVSLNLQGHLDWNARMLTLSRPGVQPAVSVTSSAPVATPPAAPSAPRNPFRQGREGDTVTTTPAPVPVTPVGPAWKAEPGSTLRTTLTQWASTASCSGGKWLVIWPVAVDYPVSAPLTFNGPFEQVMTELFTLYQKASIPLYAGVSRQQCVISVSDTPFIRGGTP